LVKSINLYNSKHIGNKNGDEKMIEKIKQIVMDEKYCVLATAMNNKPHCSLMAYTVGEDFKRLYMVTHKDSDIETYNPTTR
jgi:general stress protein 26